MCRKVAGAELTAGVTVTLTFSKQDARIYIYYFRSKALALFFCYRKFFVFYNIKKHPVRMCIPLKCERVASNALFFCEKLMKRRYIELLFSEKRGVKRKSIVFFFNEKSRINWKCMVLLN